MRPGRLAAVLFVVGLAAAGPARAQSLEAIADRTRWGESSAELLRQFGNEATALPRPLDFGDSYVDVVLRRVTLGGWGVIVYFQMDKTDGRLKRIQIERPRHGATPPAFRGVAVALDAEYGPPAALCGVRPSPASGFQEAAERIWLRGGRVIRAIFRDTTLEAFEGCIATAGPCGLTGQLLIRISPPAEDNGACPATPKPHSFSG